MKAAIMEVTFLLVLLMFHHYVRCEGYRYEDAKRKAIEWLKIQREANVDWKDIVRSITALMLVEDNFEKYEKELYTKELELVVTLELSNPKQTAENLAIAINGLVSTCRDPKDFYNSDLINMTKSQQGYHQSIAAVIALCNSNVSNGRYTEYLHSKLNRKDYSPRSIDERALIYVLLGCMSKRGVTLYLPKDILEMIREDFKDLKDENGGFGSIYRTALILQAFMANGAPDSDTEEAKQFLVRSQAEDGSFGNIIATYFVLPILSDKTLSSISDIACEDVRKRRFPEKSYGIAAKKSRRIKYQIAVGNDKDLTRTVVLDVPAQEPLQVLDVMTEAALRDASFSFQKTGEMEVYSIGGWSNDPELSYYWQCNLIILNNPYSCNLETDVPENTAYVTFWYRSN